MPDRLKILFVVNSLGIGGSEKIVQLLCHKLSAIRFDIHILCLKNKEDHQGDILPLPNSITTHFAHNPISISYSLLSYVTISFLKFSYKKVLFDIHSIISSINPKIIHFHTEPKDLIIGSLLPKEFNYTLIFTDHSSRYKGLSRSVKTLVFTFLIQNLHKDYHHIFISKNNKKISDKLLLHTKKSTVILNSVDTDFFNKKSGLDQLQEIRVIYISRIAKKKGHEDLIHAWAKVEIKNKKLYLVGPDELTGKMQDIAKKVCKKGEIIFAGGLDKVKPILEKCHFGVFPSFQEGLPLSLLEMMSMKLPVIVSDIPELTSIIQHNQNGLVYKLGDRSDLASKIKYLSMDKEKRLILGNNARAYVKNTHNNSLYVKKHVAFYQQLVNNEK